MNKMSNIKASKNKITIETSSISLQSFTWKTQYTKNIYYDWIKKCTHEHPQV